jgi:hypothetical protein
MHATDISLTHGLSQGARRIGAGSGSGAGHFPEPGAAPCPEFRATVMGGIGVLRLLWPIEVRKQRPNRPTNSSLWRQGEPVKQASVPANVDPDR